MYENEGSETENESGASEQGSPDPASTEGQNEAAEAASQPKPDTTPFHEHPRFKELIEQKNQEASARKALEDRYSNLEKQFSELSKPKQAEEKDDLIEDLKQIDPRLAARLEAYNKTLPQFEAMQQKLANYEKQQYQERAVSQVNSLHEANKVAPEVKQMINNELDRLYMTGQLKDIKAAYENTHSQIKKWQDGIERATREAYVKDKTKDSKIPASTPKGEKTDSKGKAFAFAKNKDEALAQVVGRYLKTAKAED